MAPPRTTRRQEARDADYSNLGVAGRKTGIQLKDTGIRDEHGMEPIDGIFSSPDKPPSSRKRKSGDYTITSESEMDIDQTGAIPDPKDMLRAGRGSLPPPRSRSPMKTNLGSPARRSVGPMSSPSKQPAPRASVDRSSPLVNDSPPALRKAAVQSHLRSTTGNALRTTSSTRPTKKRTFDLSVSGDDEPPVDDGDVSMTGALPEIDEAPELNGDESLPLAADDSIELQRTDEEEQEVQIKAKRGRKKAEPSETAPKGPPKKRGRPPKNANAAASKAPPAKRAKTAGRKKRNSDEQSEASSNPRGRNEATTPDREAMRPPSTKQNAAELDRAKPRSRGLRILRSETPAADYGATVMRSGRTSVKPMAFWRNERVVYGDGRREGQQVQLPGIKEVIRTEEITPEQRPQKRRRRRQSRAPEELEDDEDVEEWETEPGFLEATVPKWDPVEGKASEEVEEEIEIAYAPKGLELATREVKGATFLYGKTLSLPFFHSGIVDLPPGGEKRPKNSRTNHIVFWVFAGRVDVNVSDNQFSIGRGGMWQVPRGNFYSMHNTYDRPARVFFAQGSYMQDEEQPEAD